MVAGTRKARSQTAGRRTRSTSRAQRGGDKYRMPWAGWGKQAPSTSQRRKMKEDCRRGKCFLGPDISFPVCRKGTCNISDKGLWAAYIRARQWGKSSKDYKGKARPRHGRGVYTRVARKAKRRLEQRGHKMGGQKGGHYHYHPYGD